MASLFTELNRRNVLRVGVFYAVAGWLVLQVGQLLFEVLDVPPWGIKLVLGILVLGFPIALICAWVFEVTEHGIKWESEIDRSESITPQTARRLDIMTMVLLVGVVSLFLIDRVVHPTFSDGRPPQALEPPPAPQGPRDEGGGFESGVPPAPELVATEAVSIAVLPFVNMSSDPEQEYFSDGMTEELLNVLVKVPGILVAARTSAFSYKGQDRDVRQIGSELGVRNIVEGSVRKAGNDLRITAQLIRVSDGFHLWSESYDRKLENVFAIQEEIAVAIAAALETPLGLKSAELMTRPTTDFETYDLYLRAKQLYAGRDAGISEAIRLMQDVVTRDPDFAPAWATLSLALEVLPGYQIATDGEPIDFAENQKIAERAARQAVKLDAGSAEAHHALANVLRSSGRWVEAEDTYQLALSIDPNSIPLLEDWRQFLLEAGRINDAVAVGRRGFELEPRSSLAVIFYADILLLARKNDAFLAMADRALELQPGFSWPLGILSDYYIEIGEFDKAFNTYSSCDFCLRWGWTERYLELIAALRDGTPIAVDDEIADIWSQSLWYRVGGVELTLIGIDRFTKLDGSSEGRMHYMNNSFMDEVRRDPRFKQIVERIHLVDYWRERGWPDYCWPTEGDDFECGAYRP
jgi:TolB-like protein